MIDKKIKFLEDKIKKLEAKTGGLIADRNKYRNLYITEKAKLAIEVVNLDTLKTELEGAKKALNDAEISKLMLEQQVNNFEPLQGDLEKENADLWSKNNTLVAMLNKISKRIEGNKKPRTSWKERFKLLRRKR